MIDKFNRDPDIYLFLISTLAGGTGLNLTGANKVVIFGVSSTPLISSLVAFHFCDLFSSYLLKGAQIRTGIPRMTFKPWTARSDSARLEMYRCIDFWALGL
jgi:hypothetical protein